MRSRPPNWLGALVQALIVLRRRKPAVVVGLGGYASAACGVAAVLLRVPLVIAEQNAVPGLANRLLSRLAAGAATAFEFTDLPRATWTGNPVRSEVIGVDRSVDRARGPGSAGRRTTVAGWWPCSAARSGPALSTTRSPGPWASGEIGAISTYDTSRDTATTKTCRAACLRTPSRALSYDLVAYEDDMAAVYAAADLVVGRAGATTVAEVAAVGVPAVLVPLPGAPGDHQTANARRLEAAGGAVRVSDEDFDAARLVTVVDALLEDSGRLDSMAGAARSLARPDAAGAVVDLMESCARYPSPGHPSPDLEAAG